MTDLPPGALQFLAEERGLVWVPEPRQEKRPPSFIVHTYCTIGTDALLAALGGFQEEVPVHSRGKHELYTPADIELMRSFYRRFGNGKGGRLQKGRGLELARRLDRDPKSLRMTMFNLRKRGVLPPLADAG